MKKQEREIFAALTAVGFSFVTSMVSTKAYAATNVPDSSVYSFSERLGGKNRYETCVEVSKSGWQNGSDYVIIANGEEYADALCAAPLAKKYDAPILLTSSDVLNEEVKNELLRLNVKHIVMVGGNGAISENVENVLKEITTDVQRIYGNSRYATAVEIAKKLGVNDKIVVTSGEGFADALSIAPIAAQKGMPILLTSKDGLNSEVKEYLDSVKIQKSYIVGGKGAVSENCENLLPKVQRLSGSNRFETNLKIVETFTEEIDFKNVYIALGDGPTGKEFADALSGAAIAAKKSSPVILTNSDMPSNVESFIKEKVSPSTKVTLLGGKAAVSDETYEKVKLNSVFYNKTLTYGSEDSNKLEIIDNNADITTENVEIKNTKIKGNLYIDSNGATLKNITVDGNIYVNPGEKGVVNMDTVKASNVIVLSGAKDSIHLKNVKADVLKIYSKQAVRIEIQGSTSIGKTEIISEAVLDAKSGSFGNIEVNRSQNDNRVIEFKGNYDKPIVVNGQGLIKSAEGANIQKLQIVPENKDIEIRLSGNFKNVEVNKEAKIKIEAGNIEKFVTNVKANLEVGKNAKIEALDKKGQEIVISGEGKSNIKELNVNVSNTTNLTSKSDDRSEDYDNHHNHDNHEPNTPLPTKPLSVTTNGKKVEINYKDSLEKTITIIIYKVGSNSFEYVDQITSENGEFKLDTVLDSGSYIGKIKAVKTNKFINIPEFQIK